MTQTEAQNASRTAIKFTPPSATDGPALHALVGACQPLDENSRYCNLLHCSHFSATSVAARSQGELVGFVSGYRIPERPDTYFLWQVAVAEQARGQGLARRMIEHILARPQLSDLRFLETTITPDNAASWALFKALARALDTPCESALHFERDAHFGGAHADEHLLRIGPFCIQSTDI